MRPEEPIIRLREEGGSDIEKRILESAAHDEMPESKHRALVEWGESVVTVSSTKTSTVLGFSFAKVLGVLALASASAVGIAALGSRSSSEPTSSEPASIGTTSRPEPAATAGTTTQPSLTATTAAIPVVSPDQLREVPAVVPSMTASSPSARAAPNRPVTNDLSFGEQMKFIDDARTRLRQGDPRGALAALDAYQRRYAQPAFKEEATVLRISAHAKAGDRAVAKSMGEAFLNTHPSELYSRRVEAIVHSLEQEETR